MASCVIFEERIEIPYFRSLAEFRAWATSDECPEEGRIDFIAGCIEVDMSPEDIFSHGTLKSEIVCVLASLAKTRARGLLLTDSTRVSCPEADLSVEPDVVFISEESLDSGRVRLVPKATREPDRYVEVEGPPEVIVEIVSDSSETKDTQRLPAAYYRAGVPEFWLIDARGESLFFRIHRPGASAYEPAPRDAEGFQQSAVFATWFELTRRRNDRGRWVFELVQKRAQ
jgi:Uma2 family endonuclease